jgi:PAS domain S-box-containing protein
MEAIMQKNTSQMRQPEPAFAEAIATHAGVLQMDAQRKIACVNDVFTKITGYGTQDVLGRSLEIFDSGYNTSEQVEAMWAMVDDGLAWHGTNKYKRKDGQDIWARMTIKSLVSPQGEREGYVAICTDVTDLVVLSEEEKRMVSRTEYTRVVNRVYAMDRRKSPLDVLLTQALDILFEVPWLDVLSKGGVFLVDPEDDQGLKLQCSHSLGEHIESLCGNIKFGQCLCGRAAQTRTLVHASCVDERHDVRFDAMQPHGHYNVPIMIGDELVGVLVVYLEHGAKKNRDHEVFLTEFSGALGVMIGFKQREEELVAKKQEALVAAEMAKKAMVEAQQAEAAKSNFLSTMSHELRTPMNGVVGMLHVLKMGELSEDQGENVDLALSSADLLLTIINSILDFAKLEHGAMPMESLPVNLQDLIENTRGVFAPLALDKNLTLNTQVDPALPETILGDPTRLLQILNNFLSNAIKFTETGDISLTVEPQSNDTGSDMPGWLVIKVTDSGIGMNAQQADVIFDRFTQADNTISRKFGGTGLGLSICKQLAEAMGGSIGVDSQEGQGSTFWAKIPLRAAVSPDLSCVA